VLAQSLSAVALQRISGTGATVDDKSPVGQ
jgi:hypothetical protein